MTQIQKDYLEILNKVVAIRKANNHTIEEMGKYLNKSKATMSQFERNLGGFNYDLLFSYCGIFDINISLIFNIRTFQDKLYG